METQGATCHLDILRELTDARPWLLAPLQWPITREARSQAGRFTEGAAQWRIQLAAHFVNVCAGL